MDVIIGIDLGTTNSEVAVIEAGRASCSLRGRVIRFCRRWSGSILRASFW